MKVVINSCYGGFGLSAKAVKRYQKIKGIEYVYDDDIPRNDQDLINIVEFLGSDANTNFSKLKIVEIPDDVEWVIMDYDGMEWIAEKHRTWS